MRVRMAALAAVTAAAAALVPSTVTNAVSAPPGLRFVVASHQLAAARYGSDPTVFLPDGIYLASVGGAFEIDAKSSGTGAVTLTQVRRDSTGVQRLRSLAAPAPVSWGDGLPAFVRLRLLDGRGRVVASADRPFCPPGLGLSRVDASGPAQPAYPLSCGDGLTRATVWGVDRGWASPVRLDLPAPGVHDGNYLLKISVAPTYVTQLKLDPHAASVTVHLSIATVTAPGPCPPGIVCRLAANRTVVAAARARPAVAAGSTDGVASGDGLPDLVALPAHDLTITTNSAGRDLLNFAATVWNAGGGPFVVEGYRGGDAPEMTATQYVYQGGRPSSSKAIGQFAYDNRPGHHHWHYLDFARYDLLDHYGRQTLLSGKQSFCLAPSDPVDLTRPGAAWQPDTAGLWSACNGQSAIWLREVLPAGWGDTYLQSVAGQSFDVTGLPNGRYLVRVTANPFGRVWERTTANNTALLAIDLRGRRGARTVHVAVGAGS